MCMASLVDLPINLHFPRYMCICVCQPHKSFLVLLRRSTMDDAEKYLRRVAQIQRNKFGSSGFVSVGLIAQPTADRPSDSLPPRPKRNRSESEAFALSPKIPSSSHEVSSSGESRAGPVSRRSLMDKWFPGDVLKVSTIELSCAPPLSFIESTMDRITAMRERILQLRGGVEDVEAALVDSSPLVISDASTTRGNEAGNDLSNECVRSLRSAFQQFALQPASTFRSTINQFREFQRVKNATDTPTNPNASAWHNFLNQSGPETSKWPLMSHYLWPSSASITLLFTILVQRLLKQFRTLTSCRCNQEQSTLEKDHDVSMKCSDSLPPKHRELLIFLRLFMPTTSPNDNSGVRSGFSAWLISCLCVLDTPLDPDTDRLASSLFNTCCNQVRVIGEIMEISGDQRGLLMETLIQKRNEQNMPLPKVYNTLSDVGAEEILALYTLIIILTKVFRQNQNRLIPLS